MCQSRGGVCAKLILQKKLHIQRKHIKVFIFTASDKFSKKKPFFILNCFSSLEKHNYWKWIAPIGLKDGRYGRF